MHIRPFRIGALDAISDPDKAYYLRKDRHAKTLSGGALPGTDDSYEIEPDAHYKEEAEIWYETLDEFKDIFPKANLQDLSEHLVDHGANPKSADMIVKCYMRECELLQEEEERWSPMSRILLD